MTILSRAGAARLHKTSLWRRSPVALAIGLALCSPQLSWSADDSDDTLELSEVTVTGTRIRSVTGMDTPTPVAAISAEELTVMAPASITEALVRLPQFYNSSTAENFGGAGGGFFQSPGGGSLNLRGIGTKRTLTLLDGRRVVPATAFGGPDINMFPDQMLKRVEALTGGASAQYGTDAVSGAVNYILDTEFEGFRATAQTGFSDRKDADNSKYSIAMGTALGDKAHVLFSAGYSQQDEVVGYEGRDWYKGCGLIQNFGVSANVNATNAATYIPGNGGYSTDTPRLMTACNLHTVRYTYDGAFTVAGNRYELQSDGSVIPFARTLPTSGPAANLAVQPGGGGQNFSVTDTTILPSSARKNVFAYLDYDLTDNFTVYAEGIGSWQTLRTFARVGDFDTFGAPTFQEFRIQRDNAYLPAGIASIMDAAGLTEIQYLKAGAADDWGKGSFANISKTSMATVGFKSNIASGGYFDGWQIDGYAQYGKSELDAAQEGGIRLDRVYLAADAVVDPATNSIRCNVTVVSGYVPDCVPLNVFGAGNASAAAVDWIKGFDDGVAVTTNPFLGFDSVTGLPTYGSPYSYVGDQDKHRLLTLEQKIVELSASGPIFEGWAGPINAAVGAHYRKESIDQKVQASQGNTAADATYFPVWCPDAVVATNARCISQVAAGIRPPGAIGVRNLPGNPYQNIVETQFSNVPFTSGSFDVKEVFAETIVPLIAGQPWMENLTFQGAARWADYAGSGSIWSYKVGLDAAFNNQIRLRGTYSHDTRAANVAERFDRTGGFTAPITDRITPLPAGWVNPTAVTTVNGGNPEVEPEEGDTITAGVVFRPNFAPGLSFSVDWLRVKLKGAIENLTAQRVVDLCYQDGDQDQCARITRDPGTGIILFIPQTAQNLSQSYHESVDVELGYSHRINVFGGNERVGLRIFGSYLIESSTTNSLGVKSDSTGSVPLNFYKQKANANFSYSNGPFRMNLSARYNGGGKLSTAYNTYRDTLGGVLYDVADNSIGASVYWDARLGYEIPLGNGTMELFGNVTNLFDRDPPLVLFENSSLQTGGDYDTLGRRYVVGVNLRF